MEEALFIEEEISKFHFQGVLLLLLLRLSFYYCLLSLQNASFSSVRLERKRDGVFYFTATDGLRRNVLKLLNRFPSSLFFPCSCKREDIINFSVYRSIQCFKGNKATNCEMILKKNTTKNILGKRGNSIFYLIKIGEKDTHTYIRTYINGYEEAAK